MTKTFIQKTTAKAAIGDGYSLLQGLRDEVREIVDNASGTGLENTQRIQTLGETADTLDQFCDNEPNCDHMVDSEVTVQYSYNTPRNPSRSCRRHEAIAYLTAAISVVQDQRDDLEEDSEAHEELESLAQELQDAIDNAESVEFPGMFG